MNKKNNNKIKIKINLNKMIKNNSKIIIKKTYKLTYIVMNLKFNISQKISFFKTIKNIRHN